MLATLSPGRNGLQARKDTLIGAATLAVSIWL